MRLLLFLLFSAIFSHKGMAQDTSVVMNAELVCESSWDLAACASQCSCNIDIQGCPPVQDCPPDGTDDSHDPDKIYLAGIFDMESYYWGPDIFQYTVKAINERSDHLFRPQQHYGILRPNQHLEYSLRSTGCDETTAVRAYWELRTKNGNKPMDGIIGGRCSGESIAIARISGLEAVPQLSPASNSAKLSDDAEFPYFSRLLAPNNDLGEVGAMVALLRAFGWERVILLATDTQFSKDLIPEFRKSWVGSHQDESGDWFGTVSYSDTIQLNSTHHADQESIEQVLSSIPTDPSTNSRIILLVAHAEHAFDIIEVATRTNFQPDTIWVGPSAWADRDAPNEFSLQPGSIPGYLGIVPYRNRDAVYSDFLENYNAWRFDQGKSVLNELQVFAAEFVDGILAMTSAIASTPNRWDGKAVVEKLRNLDFEGVSGRVHFTPEGDRKDPQYSILNARVVGADGSIIWTDVGVTGSRVGTTTLTSDAHGLCFPKVGCISDEAWPGDTYPEPRVRLPVWVILLVVALSLLFIVVSFRNWRSRRKIKRIAAELDTFRNSIVGMRAATRHSIPKVARKDENNSTERDTYLTGDIEQALSGTVPVAPMECIQWCWKETQQFMNTQNSIDIYGDPAECWIKYSTESSNKLEEAYARGKPKCSPLPGYSVNFSQMKQIKKATGFERDVKRVLVKVEAKNDLGKQKEIDLNSVHVQGELPEDIKAEPQMVLVEGDIIQISTQRPDGWAFGTKLRHADEPIARQLLQLTISYSNCDGGRNGEGLEQDEANVFADTGWFQLDSTRMPSIEELADCMQTVGDSGALDPPSHWDPIADPTVAQRHKLKEGDAERDAVVNEFMSTHNQKVQVLKVERVQNLAMWQSYVVKRQTICSRETGKIANDGQDINVIQREALERFERRWLWHGSNKEVIEKILQQGFNRSFCGKNATLFGKGVYFARDASYSSGSTYAMPDWNGAQYILACRVVVGEYCLGKRDALTPDVRHAASQSLYDTSVGLMSGDTMLNPSIYVTYHDAQAYPEYLIKFKAILS